MHIIDGIDHSTV